MHPERGLRESDSKSLAGWVIYRMEIGVQHGVLQGDDDDEKKMKTEEPGRMVGESRRKSRMEKSARRDDQSELLRAKKCHLKVYF